MQFAEDPLINTIYQGIKRDIQVTYDNECYRAGLILIYCGIDAMAYLGMPIHQAEVHASDFIKWVEEYLSPNLKDSVTQVTGMELYIARCAVVHTYGVESPKTKSGSARAIGYMVSGEQSIAWDATVNPNLILLRLETLRDAFFTAIDRFLIEGYADKQKQPILETRLSNLLKTISFEKLPEGKN
ncbi:hypothetical protein ACFLW4_01090 [Chloroflexota bacterium]